MPKELERIETRIRNESTSIDDISRNWEVVVIGAGPAGCTAAIALARAGVKVLLVDKQLFPRQKICGCCLSAATLSLLAKHDLTPSLDEIDNTINQVHILTPQSKAVIPIPSGKAISRAVLDTSLALTAIDSGVTFCQNVAATVIDSEINGLKERRVRLTGAEEKIIHASLVIAADGLSGGSLKEIKTLSTVRKSGDLISVGTILPKSPDNFRPGVIYMMCLEKGYVGAVHLEDGSLDIAAALNLEVLRRYNGPAQLVEHCLYKLGLPHIEGLRKGIWRGTATLTRKRTNLSAERIFVIGDAAGYVEPFTGEGIAWAISSGLLVVPTALEAIANWDWNQSSKWNKLYKDHMNKKQAFCKIASAVLKNSLLRETCVSLLSFMPTIAQPFINQMNWLDMQETQ